MLQRAPELYDVTQGVAELHQRALRRVAQRLPLLYLLDIPSLARGEHEGGLVAHGGAALQPLELRVLAVECGVSDALCMRMRLECKGFCGCNVKAFAVVM